MEYWLQRQLNMQNKIANKTEKDINKQLVKYYKSCMVNVLGEFEATYDKLIATIESGNDPTPADLYKLDKYWQMQTQLKHEAQKLGDREIALLSKEFEKEWIDIYNSVSIPSGESFNTISVPNAKTMINKAWLADGKTFSQRVWNNIDYLVETLNDNLIHCVVTGKQTKELSELLQHRFKVSYNRANTLIRTEIAHIQTESAAQRYQEYGLTMYEFLADTDDRTCKGHSASCHALDGKKFYYSEMQPGVNAVPMHPG